MAAAKPQMTSDMPPPGRTPTWDFRDASPRRVRILSYVQAMLDGRHPEGPADEIEEARLEARKRGIT